MRSSSNTVRAILAGATTSCFTNPMWVVKTRMMTQGQGTQFRYRSTWHAFGSIAKHEGVRGFYKGFAISMLGLVHVAIQFPLYERFKSHSW